MRPIKFTFQVLKFHKTKVYLFLYYVSYVLVARTLIDLVLQRSNASIDQILGAHFGFFVGFLLGWFLNMFFIVFWIWNIAVWAKKDKAVFRLVCLILLSPFFYLPLYGHRVLEKNWI